MIGDSAGMELVTNLGALLIFFGLLVATAKLPPVRWLLRTLIGDPVTAWLDTRNAVATKPILEAIDDHRRHVFHHLGPNGTTRPLHQRVGNIERQLSSVLEEQEHVRSELRSSDSAETEPRLHERVEHIEEQVTDIAEHQGDEHG